MSTISPCWKNVERSRASSSTRWDTSLASGKKPYQVGGMPQESSKQNVPRQAPVLTRVLPVDANMSPIAVLCIYQPAVRLAFLFDAGCALRSLWGECSECDSSNSAEWKCPLAAQVYNALADNPADFRVMGDLRQYVGAFQKGQRVLLFFRRHFVSGFRGRERLLDLRFLQGLQLEQHPRHIAFDGFLRQAQL